MSLEPQPEWQTLLEVIDLLGRNGIPYMLTGSLAKTFYATPRMTRDIDIVVEFERKKVFQLQSKPVWVVSPEDLILSKLYWAKDSLSEMQLSDVRDLLQSVANLDMAYLKKWIHELGLESLFAKVTT